jgi:processive 1,2-diacylglycerol beta-glucosyltransferase
MKKYLILTASYWTGHNAAASAIKNHLEPLWHKIKTVDLTELLKKWWDNSRKFYAFTEKVPFIWDATFNLLDQEFTNEILDIIFKSIYQKKFNEIVMDFKPDFIICTFPNWPALIRNYCKVNKKTFKTWVVVTDAIEIWMPWYYWKEIIDSYFVIDKWTKEMFASKFNHLDWKDNVHVSFFPLEKEYFLDKKTVSNKKILILLTWIKSTFANKLLEKLDEEDFYEEILIIKWRKDTLYKALKQKNTNKKIRFTDFVKIKDILKDYDLFIAKPGWTIMCESIAQDVPLISPSYIPGQEEWNIKLMLKENVWIYESDAEKVIFYMKFLDWSKFIPNFHRVKKQNAIEFIIEKLGK